jgi:hypothetical protein
MPAEDSFLWFTDAAETRGVGPKLSWGGTKAEVGQRLAWILQLPSRRSRNAGLTKMKALVVLKTQRGRSSGNHLGEKACG